MPEWAVGRHGGEREASYDVRNLAREREQAAKETPEQTATKRVELLWHDADSAKQRAGKLSAIVVRQEWREEREALNAKHGGLEKELEARAVDAEVSERARERYTDAAGKIKALGKELASAKEPRPMPPVRDEVELEPSIIDHRLPPERLLAWVASLDKRERQAMEDRLLVIGGSEGWVRGRAGQLPRGRERAQDIRGVGQVGGAEGGAGAAESPGPVPICGAGPAALGDAGSGAGREGSGAAGRWGITGAELTGGELAELAAWSRWVERRGRASGGEFELANRRAERAGELAGRGVELAELAARWRAERQATGQGR